MARLIFKLSTRSSKQYRSKGIEEFYWEKRIDGQQSHQHIMIRDYTVSLQNQAGSLSCGM